MRKDIFRKYKVAIVHDWLNGMRGGEKCLEVICELFPEADLYTLIYQEGKLSKEIESMKIKTSFIQGLPFSLTKYRYFLPLFPSAIQRFDFSSYDLIISSSHCVAKGVKKNDSIYHISYIHAPMRYVWDQFDTYFMHSRTPWYTKLVAELIRPYLMKWDRKTSNGVDTFLCNSQNIQKKILNYYKRESEVIYPPVNLSYFKPGFKKEEFYIIVGALAPNKRVDLAIEAFNKLNLPLKVSGSGQDEEYCRSIAGRNIDFLGVLSDKELLELYQKARALVFPGEDDFGIIPLEAQACNTPVIAFAGGGALETVSKKTGIFFKDQNVDSLCEAIEEMEKKFNNFSVESFKKQTGRFGRNIFKEKISQAIENGYLKWRKNI